MSGTGAVENDGLTLFYRRFGTPGGTPILIVHGLSYFSYDWIPVATELASGGREVVAMDMRGFGDSSWSAAHAYGVDDYAADCIAVADHLGWERVVLMGHSMGGRNCVWCAAHYPGRVAALVLCDYSPVNAPAGSRRVAETVAGMPDVFASIDDALEYFGRDRNLPPDDPYRRRMEAYLAETAGGYVVKRDTFHRDRFHKALRGAAAAGPDMWAALAAVRCPVLAIRGRRSDMFAAETVARVADANPRIAVVEIDAGHDLAGDAPEALIGEVAAFLEGDTE